MIVLAYPGVGKETLAKNCDNTLFIDIYEKDSKEALIGLLNEVILLSDIGYLILLDADEAVRKYLNRRKVPFLTLYPALSLMSDWIAGLKERAEFSPTNLRYQRELEHAKLWYLIDNNSFRQRMTYESSIEISSFDYDLQYLIGLFILKNPWFICDKLRDLR